MNFIKNNKINIAFYLGGILLLGLSVNIMKFSALGNGAWDTVTINLRDFLLINHNVSWITLGMVSFTISMILVMIVMLYRKKLKYLFMLLPIFLVALSIDFWNLVVFRESVANNMSFQILSFICGILILPLGLTMVVKSGFPAFVFDEMMFMLMQITKTKKISYIRLGIEMTGIGIGAVFGFLVYYGMNGTLGAVNYGSFILAILLSPIMTMYYRIFKIRR